MTRFLLSLALAFFLVPWAGAQDDKPKDPPAQDAPKPPDESPNLKPAADIPAAAVEADKKGWDLLEEYKKEYKDRGLLDKAVEHFKKAESLAGKPFILAAYHLGIAYQHTEDFKEAKRKLERCLELNPKFHEAMLELADTWAWLKSYDTAITVYDRAIALKADYMEAIRNKGMALMRKSDFINAQKCVNKALEIAPKDDFAKGLKELVDKEVEGPKFAKEFKKETAHFVVRTNVDDKYTEWIARHLELIYAKYESIFPKQQKKEKHRCFVFKDRKEFLDYGSPPSSAGYYQDLTKKLVFYKQPKDTDTLVVLYHETFHAFLAFYLDHAPQWFNEGHGDYFGAATYNEKSKQMDMRPSSWRLNLIQAGIKGSTTQPWSKLMRMTQREMYDPKTMSMNYAQAWAMVYFFWHFENGKYAKYFQTYFNTLMKDEDMMAAYDSAFGKADLARMEEEWKQFTLGLKLP